ncbi:MAG TPA: excinuclease ABC subunit C, partial [Flavobacterium sp.]|nr:excinuclease ABC subunit C [Flavobacterium sp.]
MKDFSIFLSTLSTQPGVYQYYDAEDKLLYVGKAKNLKKRIQSYFNKEHEHPKTRILVRKIERIETIVVESEFDALLLENSLIKKHQPKYNILLKDDKTYPWICIKNEPFPRIIKTRKVEKDGSSYFGPYLHTKMLYSLIELVRELYPIRTCLFDLSEKNIEEKKYKVCLEYHLKKCLAPCEGKQLAEEYEQNIKHIKQILNGNYREVLSNFQEKMLLEAKNLNFEKAQQFKEKIELLTLHQKKSTVVNPSINNVDVFSILSDSEYAYINFLKLISGSIVQGYTLEIKKKLDETDEELLEKSIVEIRNLFQSHSKEIYVPFELDIEIPNTK